MSSNYILIGSVSFSILTSQKVLFCVSPKTILHLTFVCLQIYFFPFLMMMMVMVTTPVER